MASPGRYVRLYVAFAKFGLASEMAFRLNFLVKLTVELLWLSMLVAFYELLFSQTGTVAGWNREQYLFFVGCHYALGGLIESLFLENCTGFADLIRSGDLDLYLLKPIDEQFLITCRRVDWSTIPNVLQGAGIMVYALLSLEDWEPDLGKAGLFLVLFACGCAMAYSFLVMLMATAVWLVRNQSLMEMWWLFTTLMRYPRQIFDSKSWALPVGWFFTFLVPVLLVISVPADVMVQKLDWGFVAGSVGATVVLMWLSRAVFRRALRSYRSASS